MISTDFEQITRLFRIGAGQTLLELGCGRAETTRRIAQGFPDLTLIATEVDPVQHARNLEQPLTNLTFVSGGAEQIDLPDNSVNYVLMLKSLHHVPVDQMDLALSEVARVLVPDGLAYISEPVYAGPFNEILRIFHDEKMVREAAHDSIHRAVRRGDLELVEEFCFDSIMAFAGFAEFESRILGATHTEFEIDEPMLERVRSAFCRYAGSAQGDVEFPAPMRVDLLRRSKATIVD